jgi:hypothetical protein
MRRVSWGVVLFLVAVLIFPLACKAPAAFEVVSLDITPPEMMAGETATVNADVRNIGGTEGAYTAILAVDSVEVEKKDITLLPGAGGTVSFALVESKAGTYQVAVGGVSSNIVVKPKLVAKEMELKYDDGEGRVLYQRCSSVTEVLNQVGFLINFLPPAVPFTVKKVLINGAIKPCPI